MSGDDKVAQPLSLQLIQGRGDRPPMLSDAELVQVRAMLQYFALIKHGCPTARRLADEA